MISTVPNQKIRVMVVEDHVLVRLGLVAAANEEPDIEVVAEVDDAQEAIERFVPNEVDVVLLDLRMPGMDGIEIIKALHGKSADVRVLMLSSYSNSDDITRAIHEGANGYVVKGMPLKRVLEGIRAVHAGKTYFPPEVRERIKEQTNVNITSRELDVLKLIAKGKSNKEIGARLGITESTVKAHLARIFPKLGVTDRAHAIAFAIKRGFITLD
jgi:DNA-binding NarL/FixJ family response regulator